MVRGRRPRGSSLKQPIKMTNTTKSTKKTIKPLCKSKSNVKSANDDFFTKSMETITQRTRNLRRSLHKIQKQFDNQAITKFFQRELKSNTVCDTEIDIDNDENACDGFQTADIDNANISDCNECISIVNEENNGPVKVQQTFSTHNNFNTDDNDENCDQNSNGSSIQPTNIFLQEPVLHLNIDKTTLNQNASIVINKHLDSNFSNKFNTFNGAFNTVHSSEIEQIERNELSPSTEDDSSPRSQPTKPNPKKKIERPKLRKQMPRKCANRIYSDTGLIEALNNSDSNSCDSGVVSDRSFELNSDANKPTTPHRIVCPTSTTPTTGVETPHHKPATKQNPLNKTTINRHRGKSVRKRIPINSAKSFFTKIMRSEVKTENTSNDSVNITVKTEPSKCDSDDDKEMIKITDDIKSDIKCQPLSRSSTPLQSKVSLQSKQMTDFYPVRRSIRKTKRAVEQEYLRHIEKAIEHQQEDGLVVKYFKDKGRGICAGRPFARGEFVVEYIGDLIEQNEADRREEIYAKDTKLGCYMYYFKHREQQWCIDATRESGKLGRLVNHSRNGNLVTKIVTYKGRPHLVLVAKHDIKEGEELTYDYGDRTRESLINHPWLAL